MSSQQKALLEQGRKIRTDVMRRHGLRPGVKLWTVEDSLRDAVCADIREELLAVEGMSQKTFMDVMLCK